MTNTVKERRCLRCGHAWMPRKPGTPRRCANTKCRSPYWDAPRARMKKTKKRHR